MRKLIVPTVVVTLGVLSACSPQEIAMWQKWHDEEPKKAERWVEEGCDQLCTETVTVGEGDSVSLWAERRHVGIEELAACSGLSHLSEMIHPGDELTIPPSPDCAATELPEPPAEAPESVQDDAEAVWESEGTSEPEPAPEAAPAVSSGSSGYGKWDPIIECESGGDWGYNGSSGYDGALQFSPGTWTAMGGGQYAQYAWQAEPWQQIEIAERTLAAQGWSAWPTCASKAGYR